MVSMARVTPFLPLIPKSELKPDKPPIKPTFIGGGVHPRKIAPKVIHTKQYRTTGFIKKILYL
jgi:hypothetical protein